MTCIWQRKVEVLVWFVTNDLKDVRVGASRHKFRRWLHHRFPIEKNAASEGCLSIGL